MKYVPPIGSADPDANYTDPVEGTVPAAAVEQPMREIASVITGMGLVPSETDLTQLDQAIDMKVAAVQPNLTLGVDVAPEAVAHAIVLRDGAGRAQVADPASGPDIATKEYTDSAIKDLKAYVEYLLGQQTSVYELCEFYYFRNPNLKPGFMPAQGGVVENAAALYPDAWAFLQTQEGQSLCVTEEEWQARSQATFATLEDGTQIGWEGTGGVPFYVPDMYTGNLRLPDLRGMYAEAAGFDSLGVGGVHGDGIRNAQGSVHRVEWIYESIASGVFSGSNRVNSFTMQHNSNISTGSLKLEFNLSQVVPTANKNQPRAWGALACVYLGRPAA